MKHLYRALLVLLLLLLFVDRWVNTPGFVNKIATILVKVENFGLGAFFIILVTLLLIRLARKTVSRLWKYLYENALENNIVSALIGAGLLFLVLKLSAPTLREYAIYIDDSFLNPILLEKNVAITDSQLLQILLYKESLNVRDSEEHRKIQESTQKIADSLGIKRVDLEFACYTEDTGDPFIISPVIPTQATGKIQLTGTGLGRDTKYKGKTLSMEDIRFAARTHDEELLNSAMEQYAFRFWNAQGRPKLSSALHFKMLLFAPGLMYKMESGKDFVIYSKDSDKPSNYYQNAPLDGWCLENGRIVKNPAKKNGSIELSEVYYSMEYTKGALAREFTRK
ncbi:MAG: hypothetical protein M3Q34_01445 [bacterium]|nr:hypothetical protein [bacterium]